MCEYKKHLIKLSIFYYCKLSEKAPELFWEILLLHEEKDVYD